MIDQGLDQDSLDLPQHAWNQDCLQEDDCFEKYFDNCSEGSDCTDMDCKIFVDEFSFDQMCKNPNILIIGKRDSGIRNLLLIY